MDIFEAARTNNISLLREYITDGQLNARDNRGSTPLIIAAYYNHSKAVDFLLKAGAKTELKDNLGHTALMGACFKGHIDIVKLLLKKGASISTETDHGATALTYAATFGHNDIIDLLLDNGANPLKKKVMAKIKLITGLLGRILLPTKKQPAIMTESVSKA
ncbi:ankyrin repeat domain-containing protein [Chitinophaga filiformis]|uniref:ankyrin repeat domain-containing protein n=1 Tax=Chitinophaga filiformis TaxID=104663 RepID=UPI001F249DAA|nr:ankyrin repeat domain-containing protein [Chitinophaga filiformis]MCF6402879.1 ankyrin repeat domain-containing protein [Chitinophaga filiformis]MCF6403203.1 ankyrin repeat domain-containing protein [Chitinophaga filiformis]